MIRAMVNRKFLVFWVKLIPVLQNERKYIAPEKLRDFEQDVRIRKSSADLLSTFSKYVEKRRERLVPYCKDTGHRVDAALKAIKSEAENLARKRDPKGLSALWAKFIPVLQNEKRYIVPERKRDFEQDVQVQETDSAFLNTLCNYMGQRRGHLVPYYKDTGHRVDAKLRILQVEAENLSRTFKLRALLQRRKSGIISEMDFSAELTSELWLKIEEGTIDDLEFLLEIKGSPLCTSKIIQDLIDRANREIRKRFYAPAEVLKREEAAYQLHQEEWGSKYGKGTYIAIHKGEVVAHAKDKAALYRQLTKLQRHSRFRPYVVQIDAPIIDVRGPRFRSRGRAKQTTETV